MQESAEELKENITFRFSKSVLDKLRFEADQRNVSVNAIAQEIVSDYHNWNAKAAKAGMIPIHKSVLAMLMDKVPEEEIVKIAEFFAETKVKDILLVLRSDHTLAAFLDVFESWLRSSSAMFGKDLRKDTYSYVIHHDLGNKWSLFLSTMIKAILEKMGMKALHTFQVTENTIMFDVPVKALDLRS